MKLAQRKRPWPAFALPANRGAMTASDVMAAPAGPARDAAIDAWCASIWHACPEHRQTAVDLFKEYRIL